MAKNSIQEYLDLKKSIANIQQEAAKILGVLEQERAKLKEDFGCKSLKEARAKHASLASEADRAKRIFEKRLSEFKKRWPMDED